MIGNYEGGGNHLVAAHAVPEEGQAAGHEHDRHPSARAAPVSWKNNSNTTPIPHQTHTPTPKIAIPQLQGDQRNRALLVTPQRTFILDPNLSVMNEGFVCSFLLKFCLY